MLNVVGTGGDLAAARRVAYQAAGYGSLAGDGKPFGHSRSLREQLMKVAVLMGSASDKAKMAPAAEMLAQLGVEAVEEVMSAHRTPEVVAGFAAQAREMGYGAIICGAGMAAHLAGAVAARTTLPVIGVPLSGSALSGVDALYATVQMPRGFPVATVAIDGAANAALLAAEILAVHDPEVADRLATYRASFAQR